MAGSVDLTGYRLTFDDEFNAFSWNSQASSSTQSRTANGTWATHYWWGAGERTLSGNGEMQFYSDPSVGVNPFSTSNGALHITAAPSANTAASGGLPYTSGMITTEGTFAQTYGYFEMRAKLPEGQGAWPAFWLGAQDHTWPPEIDILETFGDKPNQLHWASHTGSSNSTTGDWANVLADLTDSYHTYGLRWTQDTLTYYFDGQVVAQVATPADMHKPMYMIVNLAVGGSWGGSPSTGSFTPATMDIDYVRAYSADAAAAPVSMQAVSTPDTAQPTAAAAAHSAPAAKGASPNIYLSYDSLSGTAKNEQFLTGYGDLRTRAGGAGDDTYVVGDSHVPISEAADGGIDNVKAWMDYTLPANVENLEAATGNNMHLTGNDLSNYITGGTGDDWLSGEGGDDVLTGGKGSDVFIVKAGQGYDTITDFVAGSSSSADRVLLNGYGFATPSAVLASLKQVGSSVVLALDNGETLTFLTTKVAEFVSGNFAVTNVSSGIRGSTPSGASGSTTTDAGSATTTTPTTTVGSGPDTPPLPTSTLTPGGHVETGVMSSGGETVLLRASTEVTSSSQAGGGLLLNWSDGTSTLLKGATSVAFADGQLVFNGGSAGARALRAYESIQGSAPPAGSLAYTAGLLAAGMSMEIVTAALLDTQAWADRSAGLTTTQKLQLIYQDVIGYSPPAGAMEWLTASVKAGGTIAQLAAALIDTPQAAQFTEAQNPSGIWLVDNTQRDVVRAYDAVLDQTPDAASLARWSLLVNVGAVSLHDVYGYLTATELFQARHAGQSNAAFVADAYEQALERPATAAELKGTTGVLDKGQATRLDILHALGDLQADIGLGPGQGTHSQDTIYLGRQSDGDVLARGESLADIANSSTGHAVSTRSAADLIRIDVAPGGLALHWKDGSEVRVGRVEELSLADGRLELDGASREAVVTRLYEATVGIKLAGTGVATFETLLDSGYTLTNLTSNFLNTDQAHARLAGLDQGGQISLVYKGIFGVSPPAETLAYLKMTMQYGSSLADVTTWLAQLPEATTAFEKSHPSGVWVPDLAAAAVVRAYDAVLDTTPDPGSLLIWKGAVGTPEGLHALYETLMDTRAHHALYDGVSEAAWVTGHYQSALERAPSTAELSGSLAVLASGAATHVDMAMAIGELQPLVEPPRVVSALSLDLL